MPISAYSRERLTTAASASRTLSEALTKLGVDPRGPSRNYVRERMKKLGVDTSHFAREGVRWTKDEVAVAASSNLNEVLRRLGLDVVGGHHAHIARRVRAYGIDTEEGISVAHFLGQAHQRGKPSPTPRKEAAVILVRHNRAHRTRTSQLRRALHEIGVPEMCAECGTGPVWQGRPMTLEVDHVNGDWRDDRAANLRLLCPNCHAVTDTWCRGGRRRR